jgi:XcyI restriction endonuclease
VARSGVQKSTPAKAFAPISIEKQVWSLTLLHEARDKWLPGAVQDAVALVDPETIASEIAVTVPHEGRIATQALNVRDEMVFALPCTLRASPRLLGYFRLFIGVSQKQFYQSVTGWSQLKSLEERGECSDAQALMLPAACAVLNQSIAGLLGRGVERDDVDQLPLLTFGAQVDGGYRNFIGTQASVNVFKIVQAVVTASGTATEPISAGAGKGKREIGFSFQNSTGTRVKVIARSDPDIEIVEVRQGDDEVSKVSIEIKGGTDVSNAHNRIGEAEKSHNKVDHKGQRWTIIQFRGVSAEKRKQQSKGTTHWFDFHEILARDGETFAQFIKEIASQCGIPAPDPSQVRQVPLAAS